jgi:uncharacterized protein (DUF1501 family)
MTHDRRFFFKYSGLALAGFGFAPGFLHRALAGTAGGGKRVLVTLFQRGAVDGLSMVPPVGEPRYFQVRPTIAVSAPGKGEDAALRLDDTFGLHPALAPLMRLWDAGSLAIVHAVGSPDPTRSHFDAQDYLDAGTPGIKSTDDGWLNRALQAAPRGDATSFRAVALQPNLPRSLTGKAPALAMASVADFTLRAGSKTDAAAADFACLYAGAVDAALQTTGGETFESLKALKQANPSRLAPQNGAAYPSSPLGRRMKEIAQLVRSDVGLEIAATDCGGWDTHAGQGSGKGQLANRLQDLGESLAAFATDLGEKMSDVCVVTMTEFGRTVRENGTRGTDHGHGSVMTVLGGNVKGRRVLARWKGLSEANLFEGRDLAVTTDHREVLLEVLTAHLGVRDLSRVFPGYTADPALGLRLF